MPRQVLWIWFFSKLPPPTAWSTTGRCTGHFLNSLDMNIRTGHLHIYPYPKLIMNEHFGDFSKQIICDSLPMLSALQRISNPDSAHINPFSHLRAPNLLLASSISNFSIGIHSNRLFLEISASNEELCNVPRKPIPNFILSSSKALKSTCPSLFFSHLGSTSIIAM